MASDSLLSQLGLGLLTETNRNCNWKESQGGNRIAQLLHVEQSIEIKILRALHSTEPSSIKNVSCSILLLACRTQDADRAELDRVFQ